MTNWSARQAPERAIGSAAMPAIKLRFFTIHSLRRGLEADRPLQTHFAEVGDYAIGETGTVGFELDRRLGVEVVAQARERAVVRSAVRLLCKVGVGLVERRFFAAGVGSPAPQGLADLQVACPAPVRTAAHGKIAVVETVILSQDLPVALEIRQVAAGEAHARAVDRRGVVVDPGGVAVQAQLQTVEHSRKQVPQVEAREGAVVGRSRHVGIQDPRARRFSRIELDALVVSGKEIVSELALARPHRPIAPHADAVRGDDPAAVLELEEPGPRDAGLDLLAVMVGRIPVAPGRVEASRPHGRGVAENVADLHALEVGVQLADVADLEVELDQSFDALADPWSEVEIEVAQTKALRPAFTSSAHAHVHETVQ